MYIFCYLLILSVISEIQSNAQECVTPKSTVGTRTALSQCPELQDMYKNVTSENLKYLYLSQLGYMGDEPEVCCPKSKTRRMFRINTTIQERTKHFGVGNRFGSSKKLPEPPECGEQLADKIFNGIVTGIDEFPWMALLKYKDNRFHCGGVLINQRYVLTAAHCVTGKNQEILGGVESVTLGEHNIESEIDCNALNPKDCAPPPVNIPVEKKIIHPGYQPNGLNQHNDIALLKLSKDVEYSDFIIPICLAKDISTVYNTGKPHFVSGWGKTEKQDKGSEVKLKLKVPIVQENKCVGIYKRSNINLIKSQLCAGGEKGKDSCRGDSGGPLMVPVNLMGIGTLWFCSGIVSVGPSDCGLPDVPGIYTKVTEYYDWIAENL